MNRSLLSSTRLRRRRHILLLSMTAFSLFLFLFLLPSSPGVPGFTNASVTADLLQQACRGTRFPSSCATTISNSRDLPSDPSPLLIISIALSAPSSALLSVRSLTLSLLSSSGSNSRAASACRDCLEHLDLSSRRLASATDALPAGRLADARAWAGAALLYQYDCWSSLKYVNSTRRVADAMASLASLAELTSNALSMIAALQRYGSDTSLWTPPQTERDGYWGGAASASPISSGARGLSLGSPPNVTVCKTGSCEYQTVQEAVNAAPDFGTARFVIQIKVGVYEEAVRIPFEKTNVAFVGDGMGVTVITGSQNVGHNPAVTTYQSATVGVLGDGFAASDITFENKAGPGSHQSVAFRSDSDHSILESVEFRGHQDTVYARSLRQLYRKCRIAGTLDFIFGNSASVFEQCIIEVLPRQEGPGKSGSDPVTAQGRTDPAQATGFVFDSCIINGSDEFMAAYGRKPGAHRVYLGRPWKEYSRTIYVNCYMSEAVRPEGWLPWRGDFAINTLFYGEYGSWGPGANAPARVEWSSSIPGEHVGIYSLENFIQGNEWAPSEP